MEEKEKRTIRQNKALHLFFRLLADEFNEHGLDQRKVLKETIDIPWTEKAVKEQIWKPIQKALLGIESTTDLERQEVDKVWDVINKNIGEKFGLYIPFPSDDPENYDTA